ncbi:MAG: pyridoxamine 5'-phosphate oxidase family protein [Bacteroidota bacterium]
MSENFYTYTFNPGVKKAQEHFGSRQIYARVEEKAPDQNELHIREEQFIGERDSFYISTVGENGWPYVQFRGGPKGFLKVIDEKTLAYADFKGNLQYISTGNMNASSKAAIILLDYPSRTRMKILVETEIKDAFEDPELLEKLKHPDYDAEIERLVIFHVKAFDWNCPQHITPKFRLDEITHLIKTNPEFKKLILEES